MGLLGHHKFHLVVKPFNTSTKANPKKKKILANPMKKLVLIFLKILNNFK